MISFYKLCLDIKYKIKSFNMFKNFKNMPLNLYLIVDAVITFNYNYFIQKYCRLGKNLVTHLKIMDTTTIIVIH